MFGASKQEAWRQFANEVGGEFVELGLLARRREKVVAKAKEWTITLDIFATYAGGEYTRIRAPYISRDGFRFDIVQFRIAREGLFGKMVKALARPDIEVGYPEFDQRFTIRASDERKIRALLRNARVRQLLDDQQRVHFFGGPILRSEYLGGAEDVDRHRERLRLEARTSGRPWREVRDSDPVSVLVVTKHGVVKDVRRLRSLFELLMETLDQLCHIGSASEEEPGLASTTWEPQEQPVVSATKDRVREGGASLYDAPDPDSGKILGLAGGAEVEVLESHGDFYAVKVFGRSEPAYVLKGDIDLDGSSGESSTRKAQPPK